MRKYIKLKENVDLENLKSEVSSGLLEKYDEYIKRTTK